MKEEIKIVIADDHPLWRKAMISTLHEIQGLVVIGDANNAEELLTLCETLQPDLVITDLKMPGMYNSTIRAIAFSVFKPVVLVMSAVEEEVEMFRALASGAKGFIGKHVKLNDIKEAVHSVMTYNSYYCRLENEQLADMIKHYSFPNLPEEENVFTGREWDVLQGMLRQRTSAEIGKDLHISEKTVNGHRFNLMKKTKSKNSLGVVLYALKNGWLKWTEKE